jgi:putative ABC transport system permease protein
MSAPPRLALRWLEARLHPDERQELIGDLTEQFQVMVDRHGAGRARWWFWRQTLALLWGFSMRRRDIVSSAHERTRGRWLLGNAAMDWRYAWRAVRASGGTSLVAFLIIAVSLGLATTVFSISNGLLLRPLPFPSADRLVRLAEAQVERGPDATSRQPTLPSSGGRLSDTAIGVFIDSASTLELVTPYSAGARTVTTPSGAEHRTCAEVGVGFFDLLGVSPLRGRLFVQADAQQSSQAGVVLSESFWRRSFGAREDIVGATMLIEEKTMMVLGVAAGPVSFPEPDIDLWIAGRWRWPAPGARRNFSTSLEVIGRLASSATFESAALEARQLAGHIAAADPAFLDGADVPVPQFRIRSLQSDLAEPIRPALIALTAAMGLVLVVAAANLVNLLLARSTARHREMAVRMTLGAGRWRIVRPLLFEQLLISAAGCAGGAALAWLLLRLAPAYAPADLARLSEVHFDVGALVFIATAALILGVLVGLLPAWQLPGASLRDLSTAGRAIVGRRAVSADTLRRVLVSGQVALAVVLLVGAGLLGRTMWALGRIDPGYDGREAITFQVGLPNLIFSQPERQFGFFDDVISRLSHHPEVVAVGASSTLPLNPVGISGSFQIEGRPRPETPDQWPRANKVSVTAGYLPAVGTRIVRGRNFGDADSAASEPVVIIDDALARRYFDGQDPLGQRIDYLRQWRRIVGITESIRQRTVTAPPEPVIYFPMAQMPAVMAFNRLTGGLAVRLSGDPMSIVPAVRAAVHDADPTVPIYAVARLEDRLRATFATPRFYAVTIGLFAVLAVAVSVLGVYGLLMYTVERRRVEFGVRRALGGDEKHIMMLVMRQASMLVLVGSAVGLVIAGLGMGVLRSLLFGVDALDTPSFVGAALVVWVIGLAASLVPAWRAMRVDPARTLRAD